MIQHRAAHSAHRIASAREAAREPHLAVLSTRRSRPLVLAFHIDRGTYRDSVSNLQTLLPKVPRADIEHALCRAFGIESAADVQSHRHATFSGPLVRFDAVACTEHLRAHGAQVDAATLCIRVARAVLSAIVTNTSWLTADGCGVDLERRHGHRVRYVRSVQNRHFEAAREELLTNVGGFLCALALLQGDGLPCTTATCDAEEVLERVERTTCTFADGSAVAPKVVSYGCLIAAARLITLRSERRGAAVHAAALSQHIIQVATTPRAVEHAASTWNPWKSTFVRMR